MLSPIYCLLVFTYVYLFAPVYSFLPLFTVFMFVYPKLPISIRVYLYIIMFTYV